MTAQPAAVCACGEPQWAYGFCRACWRDLPDQGRKAAIEAVSPNAFRAPNRRLEWRTR